MFVAGEVQSKRLDVRVRQTCTVTVDRVAGCWYAESDDMVSMASSPPNVAWLAHYSLCPATKLVISVAATSARKM